MAKVFKWVVSLWGWSLPLLFDTPLKPVTNALASEISQPEYTGNSLDMALLSGKGLFLKITFFPRYCPLPPGPEHIMADNVLSWCTLWAATDCAALVINWIMSNIQAVTGRKCWLRLESVTQYNTLSLLYEKTINSCISLGKNSVMKTCCFYCFIKHFMQVNGNGVFGHISLYTHMFT